MHFPHIFLFRDWFWLALTHAVLLMQTIEDEPAVLAQSDFLWDTEGW